MIVAIDGAAGTGKTSVARHVATLLGFVLVDSGALYRALAWKCLQRRVDLDAPDSVAAILQQDPVRVERSAAGTLSYWVDGRDVSHEIRLPEVSEAASRISIYAPVRYQVGQLQRQLVVGMDAVVEGRDTGSVVFPDAECKFFLTAAPQVRAQRRWLELRAKYPELAQTLDLTTVQHQIEERDRRDRERELAPLVCAPDAISIDTSSLTCDEVVAMIVQHVRARQGREE